VFIGGNASGDISARARKGNALNQFILGGSLTEGGLNIEGNVGKMTVASSLGITGTLLQVTGSIKSLTVQGDLFSNLKVGGVLGRLNVTGSIITGVLIEAQRIGAVTVGGDVQPGVTFRTRQMKPPRVGGQMLGTIEIV
jgi:hypothetical protein